MDNGLYRDRNGENVRVERTRSGYVIRYGDGRVIAISTNRRSTLAFAG
jgi:hypothetical protein